MAEAHHAASHSPLDHVVDNTFLEFPWGNVPLPKFHLGLFDFQLTRFMVMEVVAALLISAIVIPLARHVAKNPVTRGGLLNAFEAMLLFIRDGVARQAIGGHGGGHDDHGHGATDSMLMAPPQGDPGHDDHPAEHAHEADAFLPYLWTVFFFVLFNNLLGMIPGGASPTGNINVTFVLAVATFVAVLIAGMKAAGPVGFWVALVPRLDVPKLIKPPLVALLFVIEVAGLLIRHFVLCVRLFANMLAGHIVLAVILGFIIAVGGAARYVVTPASVAGLVALSLLELFVAFLQAYIFTFLSALFIGSAVHPH